MTTTTDERATLGDWAAEMMGWKCALAPECNRCIRDGLGHVYPELNAFTNAGNQLDIVSWAGMGLLVEAMITKGYMLNIVISSEGSTVEVWEQGKWVSQCSVINGDVPLAAFQAAREAIGVPNPESAPTLE